LRVGLLGSQIFALSSGDIGLLPAGGDNVAEDDYCAYTWILLQIPKSITPTRTENSAKIELIMLILKYRYNIIYTIDRIEDDQDNER
jgi:hypothetical protein